MERKGSQRQEELSKENAAIHKSMRSKPLPSRKDENDERNRSRKGKTIQCVTQISILPNGSNHPMPTPSLRATVARKRVAVKTETLSVSMTNTPLAILISTAK
jgi:hypothetical protein